MDCLYSYIPYDGTSEPEALKTIPFLNDLDLIVCICHNNLCE